MSSDLYASLLEAAERRFGVHRAVPPETYGEFVRRTLPPGWSAEPAHIRLIIEHLERVRSGQIKRLRIHMPPRHGKTSTTTLRFPVYWLSRDPGSSVLVTAYNQALARRFGRTCRNMARELGILSDDAKANDDWQTTGGGSFLARGVGSPPTGVGFQLIVIDDPLKSREEADSELYRQKLRDWYTDDLYTRLEPDGAIVAIFTRWHEDDLASVLEETEPGGWVSLRLPALAEDADPLGRKPGEALWPERYPVNELERIRQVQTDEGGSRSWESLYQQNPTPREGSFFRVGQLQYADAGSLPPMVRCVRRWDVASSTGSGDWTAGVLMGVDAVGRYYVLDVVRGQWDTDERNRRMQATAAKDGTGVRIIVPQDPGAGGKDMSLALVRLLSGYPVTTERETAAKENRADPLSAQVNAGNVTVARAAWTPAYVEELRTFPAGRNDDQVDASAGAFNALAGRREIRAV